MFCERGERILSSFKYRAMRRCYFSGSRIALVEVTSRWRTKGSQVQTPDKLAATYVSPYIMCTLQKLNRAIDCADRVKPLPPPGTQDRTEMDRKKERKNTSLEISLLARLRDIVTFFMAYTYTLTF